MEDRGGHLYKVLANHGTQAHGMRVWRIRGQNHLALESAFFGDFHDGRALWYGFARKAIAFLKEFAQGHLLQFRGFGQGGTGLLHDHPALAAYFLAPAGGSEGKINLLCQLKNITAAVSHSRLIPWHE